MTQEDEKEPKCLDALEKDFRFDVELANEKVDNLEEGLDRQKARRWINRLKLEPVEGHTDRSRRIRNSYIKLLLVNLINGSLEPRLDKEPPPPNVGFCVLTFEEQNFPPDWLDNFNIQNESCKLIDAGSEGQCYLSGKTFEDGGACGYVALTTGKDDWLSTKKDSPGFTIKKRKRRPRSEPGSSINVPVDDSRFPSPAGPARAGPRASTPIRPCTSPCLPSSFDDSSIADDSFRPTLREIHPNLDDAGGDNQIKLALNLSFEPAVYYGINPLVEERLQDILPRRLLIEFRNGLLDLKENIKTAAVRKVKEKTGQAVADAQNVMKTAINNLKHIRKEVHLQTAAYEKLKCARKTHLARVKELDRRAIDNGFAGVVKCDYAGCLISSIEELEDQKTYYAVQIERLEQEWNSIKVRLSLKSLKDAVDGATDEVKQLMSRPRCAEPFKSPCPKPPTPNPCSSCG